MEQIKTADWVIGIEPEGGDGGRRVAFPSMRCGDCEKERTSLPC